MAAYSQSDCEFHLCLPWGCRYRAVRRQGADGKWKGTHYRRTKSTQGSADPRRTHCQCIRSVEKNPTEVAYCFLKLRSGCSGMPPHNDGSLSENRRAAMALRSVAQTLAYPRGISSIRFAVRHARMIR